MFYTVKYFWYSQLAQPDILKYDDTVLWLQKVVIPDTGNNFNNAGIVAFDCVKPDIVNDVNWVALFWQDQAY